MEIGVNHGENLVFSIKGRLDTVTSPELLEAFEKEVIAENLVVIDFAALDYISSAGLRVLLTIKKELDAKGKALEIHNLNEVVKEVFKVTGFGNILSVK